MEISAQSTADISGNIKKSALEKRERERERGRINKHPHEGGGGGEAACPLRPHEWKEMKNARAMTENLMKPGQHAQGGMKRKEKRETEKEKPLHKRFLPPSPGRPQTHGVPQRGTVPPSRRLPNPPLPYHAVIERSFHRYSH